MGTWLGAHAYSRQAQITAEQRRRMEQQAMGIDPDKVIEVVAEPVPLVAEPVQQIAPPEMPAALPAPEAQGSIAADHAPATAK